jgi:hypothetical protein
MTRPRRVAIAVTAFLTMVVFVSGAVFALTGQHRHGIGPAAKSHAAAARPNSSLNSPSSASSAWTPVPPATVLIQKTPVQQQYDEALAQGLASSPSVANATTTSVPGPAVSAAWPAIPVSYRPDQWVGWFVQRLLDISFADQPRSGLGGWLSAEAAPELLPGVPAGVQHKMLYLSLFDTTAVGGASTPIPDGATWSADAEAGVRWSVSDLLVQPDPQWSQILAAGWQPTDQRFDVEDVSGLLNATGAGTHATHQFSMRVYVGSAQWQQGYGTVLVDDWSES